MNKLISKMVVCRINLFATVFLLMITGFVNAADLSKVQKFYDKEDYRSAMIELKNILKENPKDGQARAFLGRTYLMLGQALAAEKELVRAKELGADAGDWAVSLAEVYIILGRHKELLEEIPVSLMKDAADQSKLAILHGLSHRKLKNPEQARKMFEQALSLDSKNYRATLGLALLATDREDDESGMKYIDSVLKEEPENINALTQKSDLLSRMGKIEESLALMDRILELKPDNLRTRIGRAKTYIHTRESQKAAADIDWMMEKYPQLPMTFYLKASQLFLEQNYPEAEAYVQKILSIYPDDLSALRLMGAIALVRNNYVLAEEHMARLVAANENDLSAIKGLVEARFNLQRLDEAVEILEKAIQTWPEDAELMSMLGGIYVRQGKNEEGRKMLEKAAQISPDAVSVRTNLALAILGAGDNQAAIEQLEKAAEIEEGVGKSDEMLALTLAQNGEFEKAFVVVDRIIDANPSSARSFVLRGRVNLATGKNAEAQKDFKQAIKLDANYDEAKVYSARLHLMEGELDLAQPLFEEVLKSSPEDYPAKLGMIDINRKRQDAKQYLVWLEKTFEMHPGQIQPCLLLIGEYIRLNEVVKALSVARQLQKRHPDDLQVNKAYAEVLLRNKEYRRAEEYFEKLIRLNPESPEGYLLVADTRIMAAEDKKALEIVEEGLTKLENNYTLLVKKTQLQNKLGDFDAALASAGLLKDKFSDRPAGYVLEADIYTRSGNHEKAADLYQKSLSIQDDATVRIRLHQLLRKIRGVEASLLPLQEWIKKNPDDARVSGILAMGYQETGKVKEAAELYQVVLKVQPGNVLALNNLGWLSFFDLNKKSEGIAYARKAYELTPDQPAVMDTLGWILLNNGDLKEGGDLIKKAITKLPNDANIRYHLAYSLYKSGKNVQAKTELNSILSNDQPFSSRKEAEALLKKLGGS